MDEMCRWFMVEFKRTRTKWARKSSRKENSAPFFNGELRGFVGVGKSDRSTDGSIGHTEWGGQSWLEEVERVLDPVEEMVKELRSLN